MMPYRRGATVVQQPMSPWGNFLGGLGQGFSGGVQDVFRRKEKDEALVASILEKFDPAFLATDYGQLIGEALGLGGSPVLQAAGDIGARQLSVETGGPAPMGPMAAAPPPAGGLPPVAPPAQMPPAAINMPTYSPDAPIPLEAYQEYKKAEAQEQALAKMQLELQKTTSETEAKELIKINAKRIERQETAQEYLAMREQLVAMFAEAGMTPEEQKVKIGPFDMRFLSAEEKQAREEKLYFERNMSPKDYATEYFKDVKVGETFNEKFLTYSTKILTTGKLDINFMDLLGVQLNQGKAFETKAKGKTPEDIMQMAITDYYLPALKKKNERLKELHKKGNVDVAFTEIPDISKELYVGAKKGGAAKILNDLLAKALEAGKAKPIEPLTQRDTRSAVVAQPTPDVDKSKNKIADAKREIERMAEEAKVDLSGLSKSDLKFRLTNLKSSIMRELGLSEQEYRQLMKEFGIRMDADDVG